MPTLVDLTKDSDIRKLATSATIQQGRQICRTGDAAFGILQDHAAEATVTAPGINTRHTQLGIKQGKLTWRCTCTTKPDLFCKHLVATALCLQKEKTGDIYKAAGLVIKDRKLLCERSVGKLVFITPGGRIEPGETAPQTLIREMHEEFTITIAPGDLEPFGTFSADAANHPGQQVHMQVFIVKKWQGTLTPAAEIEEVRWLDSRLAPDIEVGSIFAHEVIPRLKAQNLID